MSAKVMSLCDRSHSHFTQQPVDYGFEVIRRSDERYGQIFFLTVWKIKRPLRSFLEKSIYLQNSLTYLHHW